MGGKESIVGGGHRDVPGVATPAREIPAASPGERSAARRSRTRDFAILVANVRAPLSWRRQIPEDEVISLKRLLRIVRPTIHPLHFTALAWLALMSTAPYAHADTEYLRLRALVIVYTNTFAGTATYHEVEKVRNEVNEAVEFIWRSSRMRLHLAVDDLTIYRFVPEDEFAFSDSDRYILPFWTPAGAQGSVTTDLADYGYTSGSYDVVVAFYAFEQAPGRLNLFGAGSYGLNRLLGRAGYVAIPMTWDPETFNGYFEHEFLHILSDIFDQSGYRGFPLVHNGDFFQFVNGKNASYEKWLLGSIPVEEYVDPSRGWGSVATFKDRDGDLVPDYSPYEDELAITEETFGSSSDLADTDGDGLTDLEEAIAGVRGGTDPNHSDTDGDGLLDGSDPDPLVAIGAEDQ
jgi:hypothetical protein